MVAPLKRVLMRMPDQSFGIADPQKWHYTAKPDLENARKEHRDFAQILINLGVDVSYHDKPMDGLADALYVFDPVLITDAGAVLLRMGKQLRQGEITGMKSCLAGLGIPVIGMLEPPALAEGGDIFWIDNRTLAIGIGFRTNRAGVRQIETLLKQFGIDILGVDLPYHHGPDACLHLLSLISLVDERLAVIYKPLFPVSLYQDMLKREFDFIEVPDSEFSTMGPNILTVAPRICIMLEGNPVTKSRLEDKGCKVYTYRGEDISLKAEGGPTCLTRPILRIT